MQGKPKNFYRVLALILAVGFLVKIFRLSTPINFYFDEVYHAFTATHYVHGNPQAYDPWAKPPPGLAYEWTHPPLAKLIMAGMMLLFGENSFGWRIGSVLFSTGAIAMAALLSWELFSSMGAAMLAAALLSIEGLFFVSSRIGMNDSYFICFALAAMVFYVRWKKNPSRLNLWCTGLLLGLAAATKWTTLYVLMILFLDLARDLIFVKERRKNFPYLKLLVAGLLLPIVLYIVSYAQYFYLGFNWDNFVELQKQMWYYHSTLKATHPYQSVPWQWVLNLRPVYMYTNNSFPGMTANIYNLGNSVILLFGLFAAALLPFHKNIPVWSRWFILLAYLMLWLPWSFSPRIMFFYHYAPAVPFLCIIAGQLLYQWLSSHSSQKRIAAITIVGLALLWFAFTYPNLTGIPVPRDFADKYYFFYRGWR